MEDLALAPWIDAVLVKVIADLARARTILGDAMARLLATFDGLRTQLADERVQFEVAQREIHGFGDDAGLVGVLRDVLGRMVADMVRIGASSVKIMEEVDALRAHTASVTAHGLRIEAIANTTRLISLNARIEAARLGSAGAVFRVVADEIKGLANQSGALSHAIREALDIQRVSLAQASAAVAALVGSDLDNAVASHKRLDAAIARLVITSGSSLQVLDRIQVEADAAIQALQFEDMLTQLLQSITDKLEVVRTACRLGGESLAQLDSYVHHDSVTQQSLDAGSVELF